MSDIRCILFDLGGVLVRFRGIERVAEWLGDAELGEEHWRRWVTSESVRAFELGRLSTVEFAVAFLDEFGLQLSPEELLGELRGFVSGPLEGALELLDELRPRHLIGCLSNTARLHWPGHFRRMGLIERFDCAFASCETGLLKPDPEAFQNVCRELALAPREILFFDDAPLNVEAARRFGFAACRSLGPADCRRELERRGLCRQAKAPRPRPGRR